MRIYDSTGNLLQTRGIHGLKCNMTNNSGAAVYVDAPNNSIENVDIAGVGSAQDGILVGYYSAAYNNVLFNVSGTNLGNVIHISANTNSSGVPNVSDLTVLGISGTNITHSISDQLTSAKIPDGTVGMYVVGEPATAGSTAVGYTRLASSASFSSTSNYGAVTWLFNSSPPHQGSSCATGSLFSCTNSSQTVCEANNANNTLWGCVGGTWMAIK